jgi:small GTP-binding protein
MNVQTDFESLIKILVLGDLNVGKTNIINQYTEKKFDNNYVATLGIDFKTKNIQLNNKTIKLQIWDSVGQEKYMSISRNLFMKVQGILLVYDITNQDSFDHLDNWMKKIKEVNEFMPIILIANKCDLEEDRVISKNEGDDFAIRNHITFIEVSACNDTHIDLAFKKLCEEIIRRFEERAKKFGDDLLNNDINIISEARESIFFLENKKKKKICLNCC